MVIPQVDPRASYVAHRPDIDAAISAVLEAGQYILGREVEKFEKEFANYIGVTEAVGVASGTDAITLGLRACGVTPGDSVLTVAHTAVATAAAIECTGAQPVFVDVDPVSFTIDPASVLGFIRDSHVSRLKAIVVVHLYGYPADMVAIMQIAQQYGLYVIEDCAQAHGAAIDGRKVGSWGDAAAFSFYPTKNLGAIGDAGALVTSDPVIAGKARLYRQYGWRTRHVSEVSGQNSRLDELQAAVLRVKLRQLDDGNRKRQRIAHVYDALLSDSPLSIPGRNVNITHAFHQYVVKSKGRESIRAVLHDHGLLTAVHYPVPIHLQPAYRSYRRHEKMSVTEGFMGKIFSLPMYPELPVAALRDQLPAALVALGKARQ